MAEVDTGQCLAGERRPFAKVCIVLRLTNLFAGILAGLLEGGDASNMSPPGVGVRCRLRPEVDTHVNYHE